MLTSARRSACKTSAQVIGSPGVRATRRLTAAQWAVAALAFAPFLAAPASSARADQPPAPGTPAAVAVTAAQANLAARGSTVLTAKVTDASGAPVAGVMVRFAVTDPASGAVVSPGGLTDA